MLAAVRAPLYGGPDCNDLLMAANEWKTSEQVANRLRYGHISPAVVYWLKRIVCRRTRIC